MPGTLQSNQALTLCHHSESEHRIPLQHPSFRQGNENQKPEELCSLGIAAHSLRGKISQSQFIAGNGKEIRTRL
ncbi:hypothetical protein CEXT_28311 [Caerostris extrusa]|uniref:Uncharacterized protein n=1 Tax=Caerostris extrusa TaxID=172846 RepID=A0AAV4TI95_CAEEX|nr:hypothetical protein CEXT_28311 [Caerostris extrusa]